MEGQRTPWNDKDWTAKYYFSLKWGQTLNIIDPDNCGRKWLQCRSCGMVTKFQWIEEGGPLSHVCCCKGKHPLILKETFIPETEKTVFHVECEKTEWIKCEDCHQYWQVYPTGTCFIDCKCHLTQ